MPTDSPETPEPAQRAGSGRSGRRRDRTQHDRRHGEDVVSDEPDSQGETLARARGDSRGQRGVRFGQVGGFVGCNSFANVMRGLLLAATAMLVLIMPATEVKAQTVTGICSRALAVQTPILAATTRTTCSDVTTADLASVTTLNVSAYGPTSIAPADFAGLTRLTSLRITASPQLTTVPDNAFAGLTALTTLNFNVLFSLTTLGEDAFAGLTTLENLNLSSNLLTTLHADLFDGLTALSRLELQDNRLTALDADIFDDLTALTSLDLNLNRSLAALDADIFDGLTALEYLDLSYTNQTALDADIFDGLTDLETLALGYNGLTALDADLFDGLTALKELYLNSNLLTTLDADLFDGLTALDTLALNRNLLTTLDADLFDGLTALEELELYQNGLTTLDADLFDGLTALEYLDLSYTNQTALDADIFDGLTALETLALEYNGLTTLDADLFDGLTALRLLALSGNSLTTLDADLFDGLTALETLALNSNLFTTLDADLFDGLTALATLALKSNLFTTLDVDLFHGLTALKHLYLNSNLFTTLDADIFDGLAALNRIELHDNRLTALDADIFDGITLLDRLDLKCNYFTALDFDIFDPFAATLTYLDLMSDSFTTPPSETAIRAKFPMIIDALTGVTTCLRVTVSPTSLTVTEGATGTYTVALRAQPSDNVMVAISSDNSDVTVAPTTPLTFTASNWETPQMVTVSAAQDTDDADESATLILDPNGSNYDFVSSTPLTVIVVDDDDPAVDTTAPRVASIVRETPTSSPTNADSLTWRVTFSEAVSNVDAADFVVSGTTATVTAVAAVSGVTGAYDVTASGGDLAGVSATVTLAIASSHNIEDGASNALSNTAPTGTNDNSYVVDNTAPTVTISGVPSSSDAPFTATFTFSEAVTGFAVGDITLGNATASSFTVTSTMVYTALVTPTAAGAVTVDVSANAAQDAAGNGNTAATRANSTYTGSATRGVTVSATVLTVTEGSTGTYTVVLDSQPTANVTVTPSRTGSTDVTFSPATLTFTALNWNTVQPVTVTAAQDSDAVDDSATISHAVTGGDYVGVTVESVVVRVNDDESVDTLPGAPTDLAATAVGETQINLSWTAPGENGGAPISGYKIESSPDGAADWTELVPNTDNTDTTYAHIGLAVGTTRHYRVSAINSVGAGDPSNIDDATTRPITGPITGGGGGGGGGGPTPSEVDFEWTVDRDIEALDGGNDRATGVWSDGTTLWLADNADGAGDAVYAYDRESGERVEDREFALHETNRAPRGFWSDRSVVWVSDSGQERLFAYDLATGERLEEREFALAERNSDARGIWSDEATMWVLDGRAGTLFAYDFESGELLGEYALDSANGDPHGIWSDGVTVWASDHGGKRLFAYRLPAPEGPAADDAEPQDLERVRDEEFPNTVLSRASNNSPRGIWSDGDVMYVADESDDRVFSYNMPDAIDARLASLTLSGIDIGEFSPGRTEYEAVVADGVTETAVEAEALQRRTDVVIDPPDTDGDDANGYQVALRDLGEITVTVTSQDGSRMKVYRVQFPETGWDPVRDPWPHCLRGAVSEGLSLVVYEGGGVEELVGCAESRGVASLYALHEGVYLSYVLGAPGFVNRGFVATFGGGVPPVTALVVRSDGPPSPDPFGDDLEGDGQQPWPECVRGAVSAGLSLVVYEGGSVDELEACARSMEITALYALHEGVYLSYILGAPDFVTQPFRDLFADGLPLMTPLVARSEGQPGGR